MKNEHGKISLPMLIAVIIVFIIIVSIMLFAVLKNNKIETTNNNASETIDIIEANSIVNDFVQNATVNTEKKYIDLNADNYDEHNTSPETFRIQEMENNNNGTITIRGRVYKYIDIPEIITMEQYQALLEGKALKILGEKVTKIEDDSKAKEAGYDIALKIDSKEYNLDMIYYANKNEDGTGTLYPGVDASVADGTDIYMQITVNENLRCNVNEEQTTLKEYIKNGYHIQDKNRTRLLLENSEFAFEDGELAYISFFEI